MSTQAISRINSSIKSPKVYKAALTLLSLGLLIGAWVIGQRFTPYLPPIKVVSEQFGKLLSNPGDLIRIVATSLRRLIIGIALGYSSAVLVALLMQRNAWWRGFLAPYVLVAVGTPSLVAAFLSVMFFGFSEIGVSAATAVVLFPYVLLSLSEGFGGLDRHLAEVAFVYQLSRRQYYFHVAFPELMPHLYGALRSAHAMGWKIVILTEVFGSGSGIGYQYKRAYDLFDLPLLVTWIIFFLLVVWAVEYGILQPIGSFLFRWRPRS